MRTIFRKKRSIYKIRVARQNNYHMIRFYQPDIWDNKIDWKKYIDECIRDISCETSPKKLVLKCFSRDKNLYDWIQKN